MHLFNTLIEKKEVHLLDLWTDFLLLFDFNEDIPEIENLTNEFIQKNKNEIQENLDQFSDTQKYLYLDQLRSVFGKEMPGLNNYLYEHCVKRIVEKEFPEGKEFESDNLQEILANFNNKYKYVKADLTTNTINTLDTFPYGKYWLLVKTSITDFVSFALNSVTAKNADINSKPKGFKKLLLPNQVDNLYNQFSLNPYRAVLVALDMLLTDIDEIADSKDLIKYTANYHDPTSNLNTLGKLVAKIDINDPETQIFFNSIRDALSNYTSFKFLPDDYSELREFFADAYSPARGLLLHALEKKHITLDEFKAIRLNSPDSIINIHRIAVKAPEFLELFKEHLQLLYRNVMLDTCIFPLDPMLNGRIDFKTGEIKEVAKQPINNTHKLGLSVTKYEVQFFDYLENFKFNIENEKYIESFESFGYALYELSNHFKNEVIENITSMSSVDREFYLNRLENRIKSTFNGAYAIDKDGNKQEFGLNIEHNNKSYIVEPGEINKYYQLIEPYKTQIADLISALKNNTERPSSNKCESLSIFPGKERTLLTIKEIIFTKSPKKQEPDDIWLNRFINDDIKLESIFPNSKGAGRKGDEFTEAKIWQAALIDVIRNRLKEIGCIGVAAELYFINKWGMSKYDTFIQNRSCKESFSIAKNQFQSLLQ